MGLLFWYSLTLLIIIIWTVCVTLVFTRWKERLERMNLSGMGPFVMWKTRRGREFIEGVAKNRPKSVEWYGRISVVITAISMVTMTSLLCLTAYLVIERARDIDLDPHMLLGLPGLNPLIPLWYGIIGLVVAMVVHEFSHGILSALAKVKILSLGILLFIIPMGAFVEPDEEAIKKVEKKKRVRMYSAGPASNIIVAGVFSLIFSMVLMGSVQPVAEGVGVTSVTELSAADVAGLEKGMIMLSFNGTAIETQSDFTEAISHTHANQTVEIVAFNTNSDADIVLSANLTDKFNATGKMEDMGKGYLGVNTLTVTREYFHPIGDSDTLGEVAGSISMYVTLPLQRLSPIEGQIAEFYVIEGFWSFLPDSLFWVLANICYWIFWLNLMVGLSNALPAVPLDGGYIFKDWLDTLLGKLRAYNAEEKRKKAVDKIGFGLALAILFLILWQVIGPRIL